MPNNISLGQLLFNALASTENEGAAQVPLPAGLALGFEGHGSTEHIRLTSLGDSLVHAKTGDDPTLTIFGETGSPPEQSFHLAYHNEGHDGDLSLTSAGDSLAFIHTGEQSFVSILGLLGTDDFNLFG